VGQITLSQTGVLLALVKGTFWTWIDGEVFLPEAWFSDAYARLRQRAGIPDSRLFQSKVELGWAMIERATANGVPFEAVACDIWYGRSTWLRDHLAQAGLEYYADVPAGASVHLVEPGGQPARRHRRRVDWVREHAALNWQRVELRPSERGVLSADFAVCPVWTERDDGRCRAERLLIRRDGQGQCTYTLTNAPDPTPLATLACRKSQRYFIERANQDAKSEYGWDDFQATKLLAWEHQLALTLLAAWFIAETKLDWVSQHATDPALLDEYQVEVLPALSVANVRLLLCAALPLPALSPAQATDLVIKHLDNRARSRKSRLKNHPSRLGP
jgi:SRSO17 transposase